MPTITSAHFLDQHARSADRVMCMILWGLFVMALVLSSMHDTLRWALLVGLPGAAIPTALVVWRGGRRSTSLVVASALMVFVALHIHQAAGKTERNYSAATQLA